MLFQTGFDVASFESACALIVPDWYNGHVKYVHWYFNEIIYRYIENDIESTGGSECNELQ